MYHSFVSILERLKRLSPRYFKGLGLFLPAVGIAVLLLVIPPIPEFARRLYELGFEMTLFLMLVFWALFSRRGLFWEWISFTSVLSLFSLSLAYKWQTLDNNSLISGFFPWSDNYVYYDEAQRLLHGFNLTSWGARRPVTSAFLSVLLAITHNDFHTILILLVLLNGLVVYLTTREIQASLKSIVGSAIYLIVSFLFYRRFAGTVLSENLGFLMGNLALIFFLQGTRENEIKKLYWGLFVLAIGLSARAGAFFILPTLAIWVTYVLRQQIVWWRVFAGAILIIFLGTTSNLFLLKLIGPTDRGVLFSNYSYTFYGLAVGGKGWNQVLLDYPGVKDQDVASLAIQKIKENPRQLLIGIIGSYRDFFTAYSGAFSFMLFKKSQKLFINLILWILTAIGLTFAVLKWKQHPLFGIALSGFLGILLSVSLLPPVDSDLMRVYATTIPITAYIVSLGVSALETLIRNYIKPIHPESSFVVSYSNLSWPLSITLLLSLFFGVLVVKQYGQLPQQMNSLTCEAGSEQINFLLGSGSSIILESDNTISETYVPYIRISDFIKKAKEYEPELHNTLLKLNPGDTINLGISINTSAKNKDIRSAFLITNRMLEPGYHELCVTAADTQQLTTYPFYYYTSTAPNISMLPDTASFIDKIRPLYKASLWVLFSLLALDIFQFWKYPLKKIPLAMCSVLMISVGILVVLHSLGLAPIQWEHVSLDTDKIKNTRGNLYVTDLGNKWMSKTGIWNYPVSLYENDFKLGDDEQNRAVIASKGGGSFTLIDGHLYFSTSDNSDPRTNGRRYQIVWPTPVRTRYLWAALLLTVLGVFIYIKYLKPLI